MVLDSVHSKGFTKFLIVFPSNFRYDLYLLGNCYIGEEEDEQTENYRIGNAQPGKSIGCGLCAVNLHPTSGRTTTECS